ncbi:tRNA lysidine(34) synthetase TilS [Actinobacillus genomosp. 2]|uniref:tRNA lysidine(34) synthetase TilS n=1 Tax=Actinobacillus genomosp. 2 TaxID=230709 RepID=UPI002443302D|nr:tRNA lysidine(34) synthetase TilS [Actinobacillus genomosp. 2]WGE31809.1 tRNA lysidine(34) synthetase TilS [Actinobacillus genomosp. 2]
MYSIDLLTHQFNIYVPNQSHFLIGLSGGIDSVVLLHSVMHISEKLGINIRAVHIHHGLSLNADSWAVFCEQFCKQLNIPFILQKVSVDSSEGIEAGARIARYQAISEIIQPNEVFVTAHHLDDQAETFLLALKRGSGIKGLSAMQAVGFWQNFTIFRPLLCVDKTQIKQYADQQKLTWIEDESNQDNHYDRNFLRNEVLPVLNQRWQHFNQMVARSAQHCAEQQALLEELLSQELNRYANFLQKRLNIADFPQFSLAKQQQLIRLWLDKCGVQMPSSAQLDQVINQMIFANADKNPQIKLANYWLRRYQNHLYLTGELLALDDFCQPLLTHQTLKLPYEIGELQHLGDQIIYKKSDKLDRLLLPKELVNSSFQVKLAHQGKVQPYGKPMREEMKKLYQQAQVPVWLRKQTPLIFWGDQLVFLCN